MESVKQDKIRVLLVDGSEVVRRSLRELINWERDMAVCGEAEHALAAVQLAVSLKPHVVVLDLSLGDWDGDDARYSWPGEHGHPHAWDDAPMGDQLSGDAAWVLVVVTDTDHPGYSPVCGLVLAIG